MNSSAMLEVLEAIEVRREQGSLANPLGLDAQWWAAAVCFKVVAGFLAIDFVVVGLCKLLGAKKLPTRDPVPIMKGLERLAPKDYLFLLINQVIETVGVMHMLSFALWHPGVVRDLGSAGVGNVVGFVYFVFLVDDAMYYWAHRAMHHPLLYALVHKHHHRQAMPTRGYLDAANEHPFEQVLGLCLVQASFHLGATVLPFGVHAFGVPAFLSVYAATALLNHTPFDVQFGWAGLGYSVRSHEMHHRFPQCNYAQNTMLFDKLLGTYAPYRGDKLHPQ